MKRPGAQEVIDEVADLRKRYEELKKRSTGKVDELADLLAKVRVSICVHMHYVLVHWFSFTLEN